MLEQSAAMQHQVQAYLDRARISARHATVTSRTEAKPALERIVRVIAKLNPQIDVERRFSDEQLVFAGEEQDFEEIVGNLLENGARFASSRLRISASRQADAAGLLLIEIEDDGPGMSPQEAEIALKRGMRLDESTPGSGLGLSIVKDIVAEYGGRLALGRSELGGLRATVRLPSR